MNALISSLSFIFICLFFSPVVSQDAAALMDKAYGLDQTLYNGKRYSYFLPLGTKGDQYLLSPRYMNGTITLKGKTYQNLPLNYDIVNQELLLQYQEETGGIYVLEVSKAWITGFSMDSMNFEFLSIQQEPRYYQVLGSGAVKILYYWQKKLDLDVVVGSSDFAFTKAVRESYVYMDGQLKPFRSKRSLIGLFNLGRRQEIKSYLRKHKINVKKASDKAMAEMITFIGNTM